MRLAVTVEELPDRRPDHPHVALRSKTRNHLLKRGVGFFSQRAQDELRMRIEHRARRLALLGWQNVALSALAPPHSPTAAILTENRTAT